MGQHPQCTEWLISTIVSQVPRSSQVCPSWGLGPVGVGCLESCCFFKTKQTKPLLLSLCDHALFFQFPFPSVCSLFWHQFHSRNLCFPQLWWAPSRCSLGKFSPFWEWAPSQPSVCYRFPIPTANSSSVILTLFIIFKSREVSVSLVDPAGFPVLSASMLSESSQKLENQGRCKHLYFLMLLCVWILLGVCWSYWSPALLTSCWLWCRAWGSPPAAGLCPLGEILRGAFSLRWSVISAGDCFPGPGHQRFFVP